jgi:IS30 family transposase
MGRRPGTVNVSGAERAEIVRRALAGERVVALARALGRGRHAVRLVLAEAGVPGRAPRPRSALRLSPGEREEVSRGIAAGESLRSIGRRIARAPSTVSREVRANGGRARYRAHRAERRRDRAARRPRAARLARNPALRAEVEAMLGLRWSPQQVAATLRRMHPDDPEMRVSHETVYRSLYVQGRGALRRELAACLRTGRAHRRAQGRGAGSGQIRGMVLVSERPAEAADRAVPGHWEGDLLVGARNRSVIATLVERSTRFAVLVSLPGGQTAEHVRERLAEQVVTLPAQLRRSLTWDRGKEMAGHARFTLETGLPVYFCDPHSPWQRGTNENTNGLLRQYFPKGTDFTGVTQEELDAVAAELNGRPRQTLGWRSPSEALAELLR